LKLKKGSIMIFCVVMMTAVTTVVSATLDLSRIVELRQHQMEREAAWDYTEFAMISIAEAKMKDELVYAQDETRVLNGISARIQTVSDPLFEGDRGVKATISGILEGKNRQVETRIGKRGPINPFWFAFGYNDEFEIGGTLNVIGDSYHGSEISYRVTPPAFDGNYYTSEPSAPLASSAYRTLLNQSKWFPTWVGLDYLLVSTTKYVGNQVWSGPSFSSGVMPPPVYHVSGNLDISGNYSGNATIYVAGNLMIKNLRRRDPDQDRFVFIVDGNVLVDGPNVECFIVTNRAILPSNPTNPRINFIGSFWCNTLTLDTGRFVMNADEYFWINPGMGVQYRIPGLWEEDPGMNPLGADPN
jgi:hypothetical protein